MKNRRSPPLEANAGAVAVDARAIYSPRAAVQSHSAAPRAASLRLCLWAVTGGLLAGATVWIAFWAIAGATAARDPW